MLEIVQAFFYGGNDVVRYEIERGVSAPCQLVSIVKGKSFGGKVDTEFRNFVCEGTHTYCMSVKEKLEVRL